MISTLDIVKLELGEQDSYSGEDFERVGRPMLAGCASCHATLGPWESYPSRSGFIYCDECLPPGAGFRTVSDLYQWERAMGRRALP